MGIERRIAVAAVSLAAYSLGASETSTPGDGGDTYQDRWGPTVGDAMPAFAAEDQDGNVRDFASLSGERGLVLVVSRSAVW
ncbi:MAG: hypothetical protein OXU77_02555 [Gammaproteobacteria bacterium]|nr:hypothetical protein [Gammaproteobacteria bacterium]MDE0444534.1 hypothetical protein [Gammaproteobacteria bacterium]